MASLKDQRPVQCLQYVRGRLLQQLTVHLCQAGEEAKPQEGRRRRRLPSVERPGVPATHYGKLSRSCAGCCHHHNHRVPRGSQVTAATGTAVSQCVVTSDVGIRCPPLSRRLPGPSHLAPLSLSILLLALSIHQRGDHRGHKAGSEFPAWPAAELM